MTPLPIDYDEELPLCEMCGCEMDIEENISLVEAFETFGKVVCQSCFEEKGTE